MPARRLLITAVAATLLGCIAACSGGTGEGPSALPSVTPSPSSTMTPAGSGSPAVAAESDKRESAERFARMWHEEFNAAQGSGDFTQLEQLNAPSCALCSEEIASVKQFLERGQEIRGGEFQVLSVSLRAYSPPSALVEVTSMTSAAQVIDSSGNVVESFESTTPDSVIMNLLENGSSWIVQDMIRS